MCHCCHSLLIKYASASASASAYASAYEQGTGNREQATKHRSSPPGFAELQ